MQSNTDPRHMPFMGRGAFRVILWMGTVEYAHWKNLERIKNLEQNRLNMLLDIIRKILKDKPERILGACYHSYLLDGKLQKVKGEKNEILGYFNGLVCISFLQRSKTTDRILRQ